MKISPLEIRQKTFEKNFRGYDKDEVDAYLLSLSQEWERVMDEIKELKSKVAYAETKVVNAEKEVVKLREVETTLYKTLKTAEDTGANIVGQANKSAELLIKESQMNAESMMNDARTKAKNLVEDAEEKVRNITFQAQNKVNEIVIEIKSLEGQKQNLVHELKQFANSLIDRANMAAANSNVPDFNKMMVVKEESIKPRIYEEVKQESEVKVEPANEELKTVIEPEEEEEEKALVVTNAPDKANTALSFFDQIN